MVSKLLVVLRGGFGKDGLQGCSGVGKEELSGHTEPCGDSLSSIE
jgi:hypothetical protein